MKKLVYVIMILFMLSGCMQNISIPQKANMTQTEVESIAPAINKNTNDYYYTQEGLRDLMYRIYKDGIRLEKGAKVYISEPDIEFQDESKVSIWVSNLEANENQKIMDYIYPWDISFIADKSGTYMIYAIIENKDSISYSDLTKHETIEISIGSENIHEIIPLKYNECAYNLQQSLQYTFCKNTENTCDFNLEMNRDKYH